MTELKDLKEKLLEMPIYHLMLGGLELSHSFFIGWLIKQYPKQTLDFFGVDAGDAQPEIKREKHHFDLLVTFGDTILVIENKFKSLIDRAQLERYEKEIKKKYSKFKNQKFWVLEFEKSETELPSGWQRKSYEDLNKRLEELIDGEVCKDDEQVCRDRVRYMRDYRAVVASILKIKEIVESEDNTSSRVYWFGSDRNKDLLEELRLYDTIQKRRAQQLAAALNKKIKAPGAGWSIEAVSDFRNKNPIVTVAWKKENNQSRIGVQIQGDQFRRAFWKDEKFKDYSKGSVCEKLRAKINTKKSRGEGILEVLKKNESRKLLDGWLAEEKNAFKGGSLGKKRHAGKELVNSFQPCFIYQYVLIKQEPKANKKSIWFSDSDQLHKNVQKELKCAAVWIKRNSDSPLFTD